MGQGHGHGHLPPPGGGSASARHLNRLWLSFAISAAFMLVEVVVSMTTSSLALASDAAHMFTDVLGVGMALAAIVLARRSRRTRNRTFGLYRAEVLAALANAVLLFGVAGYVLYEAVGRLAAPPEVPGLPVLLVAAGGLVANLASFLLLRDGAQESLNVRGAYLEVLADLIGSVGVLVSGAITLLFGWRYADPLIGVAIGLFVLPRTWKLARRAVHILFQHAPERLDVAEMSSRLTQVAGVNEVHDLHVWTLTSGMEVASAHLATEANADPAVVLAAAQRLLAEEYRIEHATLQVEPTTSAHRCHELSW
ncbi:cation diffusion facilitator family transporter [Goodfellowiella coeruleoviolacea]|uniref:Cobalt-zinc-cadmium efflux system protein n=1 Tax=Goodfellowiella coeruleoviolacea TaxID=334858 RepID=A0AAE3GGK6_9PSEU|nr:cation diffusion facilitator family transporter [Goodfellowiella coeruleoviolacea]MCP2166919.1 cobalt-zinc-cadmium efflux system protein [Goodfellowiella coeruleoviolacea]